MPADEVNRPPIARADLARTRSGVPVAIDVVANDSDPDGDIIAVESIRSQPSGGTARVSTSPETGLRVISFGRVVTSADVRALEDEE